MSRLPFRSELSSLFTAWGRGKGQLKRNIGLNLNIVNSNAMHYDRLITLFESVLTGITPVP